MARVSETSLINDANLKAYYKLDTGALTTDSGPNGYTLTNVNSVGEGTGKFDVCADFGSSNTNKRLYIANDAGITGGAISISCWVKLKAEIASDVTSWIFVAQQDAGNSVANWIQYNYNGGSRQLVFYRTRQGVAFDGTPYSITLGTSNWYHLVYTYDGTTIRGYVNGTEVATPTSSTGNGTGSTLDFISLGSDGGGGGQSFASTLLDDVAIFNRKLTDAEVLTLYTDTLTSGSLRTLLGVGR